VVETAPLSIARVRCFASRTWRRSTRTFECDSRRPFSPCATARSAATAPARCNRTSECNSGPSAFPRERLSMPASDDSRLAARCPPRTHDARQLRARRQRPIDPPFGVPQTPLGYLVCFLSSRIKQDRRVNSQTIPATRCHFVSLNESKEDRFACAVARLILRVSAPAAEPSQELALTVATFKVNQFQLAILELAS
jgi:hypothetical protein